MNQLLEEESKTIWHPKILLLDGMGARANVLNRGGNTFVYKTSNPEPDDPTRLKEGWILYKSYFYSTISYFFKKL